MAAHWHGDISTTKLIGNQQLSCLLCVASKRPLWPFCQIEAFIFDSLAVNAIFVISGSEWPLVTDESWFKLMGVSNWLWLFVFNSLATGAIFVIFGHDWHPRRPTRYLRWSLISIYGKYVSKGSTWLWNLGQTSKNREIHRISMLSEMGCIVTKVSVHTWRQEKVTTRLHSSRMRTVCCSGCRGVGVSTRGVSAHGGVCLGWGVYPSIHWTGVWYPSMHWGVSVDRILDTRLWKHYLSATTLRTVKITLLSSSANES